MYVLYVVRCADATLYTGITVDISRRITEHNTSSKGARYTRSRRPVRLVYVKKYRTRSTATKAELQFKQLSRNEKLQLIKQAKRKAK
ncbi:MAG: GIY-YIG nuclease family protein [Patescibacteria group bacterium]